MTENRGTRLAAGWRCLALTAAGPVTAVRAASAGGPTGGSLPDGTASWWMLLQSASPWLLLSLLAAFLVTQAGLWLFIRRFSPARTLRRAITRGAIVPWYQPVVCAGSGRVVGCEVLARWRPDSPGAVPPSAFIPLAERTGLLGLLTQRLIRQVVLDVAAAGACLPRGFHLSVNVSPSVLPDAVTGQACRRLQAALAVHRATLVLEVTEQAPLVFAPAFVQALQALHGDGVRVALDDFGTGYSGPAALAMLPVDYIKLDGLFIAGATTTASEDRSLRMALTLRDMARRAGVAVVAEGVERAAQRDWLLQHGITWQQGFLYSRPLPFPAFCRWLERRDAAGYRTGGDHGG